MENPQSRPPETARRLFSFNFRKIR